MDRRLRIRISQLCRRRVAVDLPHQSAHPHHGNVDLRWISDQLRHGKPCRERTAPACRLFGWRKECGCLAGRCGQRGLLEPEHGRVGGDERPQHSSRAHYDRYRCGRSGHRHTQVDTYPVVHVDRISFADDGLRTRDKARDASGTVISVRGGAVGQAPIALPLTALRMGGGQSGFAHAGPFNHPTPNAPAGGLRPGPIA